MADFFNPLPDHVTVGRHIYRLTPAFDNVLNMYTALEGDLTEAEMLEIMLYYLVEKCPRDVEILNAVTAVMFPPVKRADSGKSFDMVQDAQYIYAAFRQAYNINLLHELGRMHWWEFNALLQSLPQNTRFMEIVQIRIKPFPKATKDNGEERAQLAKLKAEYALKISEEERQSNLQKGLMKIARIMGNMAEAANEKKN